MGICKITLGFTMNGQIQTAFLAGGCFWCLDAVFRQVKGVQHVESGYMGGHLEQPDYESVCSGESGHAEVVRVDFDADIVPFNTILQIFFAIHDPTQLNRQGNDVGTQYRSAIFWCDESQAAEAQAMINTLAHDQVFNSPVQTELVKADAFYPAEAYHQDYYRLHPGQGYCAVIISPKLAKFRQHFSQFLKQDV
jgi:peptide-methionine (S)-S-oxide reductase